ncbi:MAG: HYR domain-containing protein [Saprospiraceae bacterium]|nr:HYR domain-containing protein [Saprospiraceae bacterium]
MKQNDIRLVLLLGFLAAAWVLRAQPGGWSVNSADFQFSMSMVAQIETGGAPNNALDNHVAAFSGGQIRGYATPIQIGNQAYYFFNLYANTYLNDSLYFLAFVGAENRVYESTDTVVFLHQKLIGDIQNPFVLHFMLSPKPLIYSLAHVNYFESNCTPGPLLDVQASDDQDSEGNGLKYHIVDGPDSSRFQLDSLTGILNWKNFVPDFENPQDADANNSYVLVVRVKDLSGNQSTQTITVQVKDDPVPTAGCPPAITANTSDDGTGDCSTTVTGVLSVTIPTSCATYPVSYVLDGATTGPGTGQLPANQVFGAGKTTVHYTVTDESGTQSSACSFTVTVTDDEAPALTCPANIAVNTDPDTCIAAPAGTALTVTDNCTNLQTAFALSGATQGTGTGQLPVDQAFVPGVTTVTYSVRDDLNQPATTCSFTVTVTDNVPPAVTCPANISVALSSGCFSIQSATAATVTDNCSGFALTYLLSGATNGAGTGPIPGGQKFQAGLTTAVYTATDGSGQSSCSFTVTVRETQKPDMICPANTSLSVSANCEASLPDYLATVEVSDNCTPDTALVLEQTPLAGTILQGNTMTTVQLTATDLSGNSKSCTFKVTVEDLDDVQITCPPNQEVCDGVVGNYVSLATVMTGCTSSGTPTVVQMPAANTTIPTYNGQTTVTLTATDGPSTSSCAFVVQWKDSAPPTAVCKNATVALQSGAQVSITTADINNNSTDNCGIQNLALDRTSFDCDDVGMQTVTLTVTDVNGLTNTCTATVTINDPSGYCCAAPQALCQTSPTLALGSNGQASITVADIDNGSTYECGLQSIAVQPTSVQCSNVGTPVQVTLTVVDANAQTSSCMTALMVLDTTAPALTCPSAQTLFADANCSGMVGTWVAVSKQDNCTSSASIGISQAPAASTVFSGHNSTQQITLTATDASGNTATCVFSVTLQDTVAPQVVCKNATVNLVEVPNVGSQATITTADVFASGSDNCGNISLGVAPSVFTCSHLGNNTVTLTATDQQGLSKTCQATVTVKDLIVPKITCPAGQIIFANASCTGLLGDWLPVSKSDNCTPSASVSVAQSPAAGTILSGHNSTQQLTLTATDGSGNTASCVFSVTLQDTLAPQVVCQNATVNLVEVPFAGSQATITTADVFASGSDNCGNISLGVAPSVFTCSHLGNNTVTLTATDQQGLTKTCQATVTVKDLIVPKITCPAGQIIVANTSCTGLLGDWLPVSKSDNCTPSASVGVAQSPAAGTVLSGHNDMRTVTLTATDGSGNTADCMFSVTLKDNTAPSGTCKNATVSLNNSGSGGITASSVFQSGSDNCGTVNPVSVTPSSFSCTQLGTVTVTLLVNDGNGNTQTCQAIVTVQDTQKPVFTNVPANVTVQCNAIPSPGTATATDNCGATVAYNGQMLTAGACPDTYVLTRQWTATDGSGNTQTATQRITVRDTQAPVFTSTPAAITVQCSSIPAVGTPAATDNCDTQVSISYNGQSVTAGACTDTYILTRQWTATDNCGNTKTATQRITVRDTQAPVFTSVPKAVTVECSNIPPVGSPVATDNCDTQVSIDYNGQTTTAGSCPDTYVLTRKWTAMDNCGNTRTATQRLTVRDLTKPVFTTVPAPLTLECSATIPAPGTVLATDNCDQSVAITFLGESTTSASCAGSYLLQRTWLATDNCGNSTATTQTITVQDTQAPSFTSVPADFTMECSDLFPLIGTATATDACGGYVQVLFLGEVRTDGDCLYNYTLTRTWRALDECGNIATATQVITVQDTEAPVFNNPPAGQMVSCTDVPAVPPLTAQDNCGPATVTYQGQTQGPGDCNSGYTITRTWLAVDLCGNQQTNTQVIVVMPQLLTGPGGPGSVAVEKIDPVPPATARPHVAEQHFRLTPNPARDEVVVSFVLDNAGQTHLELFDTGGRIVQRQQFDCSAGPNYLYLDVRDLAAGWYVLQVRADGLPAKALKLAIERK